MALGSSGRWPRSTPSISGEYRIRQDRPQRGWFAWVSTADMMRIAAYLEPRGCSMYWMLRCRFIQRYFAGIGDPKLSAPLKSMPESLPLPPLPPPLSRCRLFGSLQQYCEKGNGVCCLATFPPSAPTSISCRSLLKPSIRLTRYLTENHMTSGLLAGYWILYPSSTVSLTLVILQSLRHGLRPRGKIEPVCGSARIAELPGYPRPLAPRMPRLFHTALRASATCYRVFCESRKYASNR